VIEANRSNSRRILPKREDCLHNRTKDISERLPARVFIEVQDKGMKYKSVPEASMFSYAILSRKQILFCQI
jgi:hypothetical protein